MIRGTTSSMTFSLDMSVEQFTQIWISFFQEGSEVMTLDKSRIETVEGEPNLMTVRFSQEDTLKFAKGGVKIQIRTLDREGNAYASSVMRDKVEDILKDGVIE